MGTSMRARRRAWTPARAVVLGLATLLAGCGDISVPPDDPGRCKTDDDCQAAEACRVGSCDTASGQCTYTLVPGTCFVGGACYQPGQEKPGDRCLVCDPALTQTTFVNKTCPAGQVCDPATGQCKVPLPDATDVAEPDDVPDTAEVVELPDVPDTADVGPDVPPGCEEDDDCVGLVETGPCEAAVCVKATGECLSVALPPGSACKPAGVTWPACWKGTCDAEGACEASPLSNAACDDGNACTLGDACQEGECLGTPKSCDDKNPCTLDVCQAATGACSSQPYPDSAQVPCEDGNPCTSGDVCVGGVCDGGPNACACTTDEGCLDDGNLCNGTPYCADQGDGTLACDIDPATVVVCDPAQDDACNVNTCDPATGLCALASKPGVVCDDGDPCTFDDRCVAGDGKAVCGGTPVACDDANVCTDDACEGGACVHAPRPGAPCSPDPLPAPQCWVGECSAAGACVAIPLTGSPCSDGNLCTTGDTCQGGDCVGSPKDCEDGNPCTANACVPETGACKATPVANGTPCDDGDACTVDDACQGGVCTGGASICECMDDGDCVDDGNLCNGVPSCEDTKCVVLPETIVTCDPSEDTTCLKNTCGPSTGVCIMVGQPAGTPCDDGDACTLADTCFQGACVPGDPKPCDDGVACTLNGCDPATGACVYEPDDGACEDANPCTVGVCNPASGCQTSNAIDFSPCSDGQSKTSPDFCFQGKCVGGAVQTFPDDPCVTYRTVGMGADGKSLFAAVTGQAVTTPPCPLSKVKRTSVFRLDGASEVVFVDSAIFDAVAIGGRVVADKPAMAQISSDGSAVDWTSSLTEEVLGVTPGSAEVPVAVAGLSSARIAVATSDALAGMGVAACEQTKTWACAGVPLEGAVLTPIGLAGGYVGFGLTGTWYLAASATTKAGDVVFLYSQSKAVLAGLPDFQPLAVVGEASSAGGAWLGTAIRTSESLHFGVGGKVAWCTKDGCKVTQPFGVAPFDFVSGWGYGPGFLLLGVEGKTKVAVLAFLPAGADAADGDAWRLHELKLVSGLWARAVVAATSRGVYVLGDDGGTQFALWYFAL